MDTVTVDENGEVEIPNETIIGRTQDLFGLKVYEITDVQSQVEAITEDTSLETVDQHIKTLTETVKAHIKKNVIASVVGDYGMKKSAQARLEKQVERRKAEQKKKSVEDEVRDHLRGFSRTIPSFIMAYGDGHLTLANFDAYTEADVFQESRACPRW